MICMGAWWFLEIIYFGFGGGLVVFSGDLEVVYGLFLMVVVVDARYYVW